MAQNGKDKPDRLTTAPRGLPKVTRVRNAVILPDGTKKEPLGSGHITGLLGVGGMANVYEIWNPQLELFRAVKLLHPNYTEEVLQRFQTEIKITAKLNHRNIIEVHAVGYWNGLPYIEMERIYGDTLEKILDERGALPLEVCSAIATMMGRALYYAHNQEYVIYGTTYHGVIHRDLKPSNIMITAEGFIKLMDFGIARPTDASIHTTDGAILGTMQYLSPEQLGGKEPDVRADIYAMGTILYELITGIQAFPENNASKLMLKKIKNEFRPLNEFALTLPSRLRRLVHRCMVYDREKRVKSAEEFLTEIGRIHRSISGRSPEQVVRNYLREQTSVHTAIDTRRRLPMKRIAAVGSGILMTALLTYIVSGKRSDIGFSPENESRLVGSDTVPVTAQSIEKVLSPKPEKETSPEHTTQNREVKALPLDVKEAVVATVASKKNSVSPSKEDGFLEQYGVATLFDAFSKAVTRRAWSDALELSELLPQQEAESPRAVVYRARVLQALGEDKKLRELLSKSTVVDGELNLFRARLALQQGDLKSARSFVATAEQTPAKFMMNDEFRLERLHCEARYAERRYDNEMSEEARRFALDRWFEVKSELRTSRDHPWYREADETMQRIAAETR